MLTARAPHLRARPSGRFSRDITKILRSPAHFDLAARYIIRRSAFVREPTLLRAPGAGAPASIPQGAEAVYADDAAVASTPAAAAAAVSPAADGTPSAVRSPRHGSNTVMITEAGADVESGTAPTSQKVFSDAGHFFIDNGAPARSLRQAR
jgi:hypothetical protein